MNRKQLWGTTLAIAAFMPPLQESGQLLGIPWWIWLVIIVVLLILLLIGLVLREEPGPPVKSKESRPFPVAKPVVRDESVEPAPVVVEPESVMAVEAEPAVTKEISAPEEIGGPETEPAASEPANVPIRTPAAAVVPNNLKRIEGIGPKVSSLLKEAGIQTFAQLAASNVAQLDKILDAANLNYMDATTWPEQAQLAAEGKWDELKVLTDTLKGGRRA